MPLLGSAGQRLWMTILGDPWSGSVIVTQTRKGMATGSADQAINSNRSVASLLIECSSAKYKEHDLPITVAAKESYQRCRGRPSRHSLTRYLIVTLLALSCVTNAGAKTDDCRVGSYPDR
jgi:hypothetical protein